MLIQMLIVGVILSFPSGSLSAQATPPSSDPSLDQAQYLNQPGFVPEYSGCGAQYPNTINAAFEQEVVELVNAERTSRHLPPLKRVELLDQASRYHAADMYQDNYFAHDSYDRQGSNLFKVCGWSTRINNFYTDWNTLGENIARGYPSPQSVMVGWMGSSGHRDNILNEGFTEIGVGYFTGNHWVQDFGRRYDIYPLIINNEAAETDDRNVDLYLHGDASTWTEMRLRNDQQAWSAWTPFQNIVQWQLPNASGMHMVGVELRKGSLTTSSNDSIYLSTVTTTAELGNLPDTISFTYSITDQRYSPASLTVTPLNVGDDATLTWQTSQTGDWFQVSPPEGDSPQPLIITPNGTFASTGTYSDNLTVTVTNPDGTLASPWMMTVDLTVVEEFEQVYLPSVMNRNP